MLSSPIQCLIEMAKIAGVGTAGLEIIANPRTADFVTANGFENPVSGMGHVAVVAFAAGGRG